MKMKKVSGSRCAKNKNNHSMQKNLTKLAGIQNGGIGEKIGESDCIKRNKNLFPVSVV